MITNFLWGYLASVVVVWIMGAVIIRSARLPKGSLRNGLITLWFCVSIAPIINTAMAFWFIIISIVSSVDDFMDPHVDDSRQRGL